MGYNKELRKLLIVSTTLPDEVVAEAMAIKIVDQDLSACVTILPAAQSVYSWEGKRTIDREIILLIKTTVLRYQDLERWIVANHPYELPEIIATKIECGFEPYLAWLQKIDSAG